MKMQKMRTLLLVTVLLYAGVHAKAQEAAEVLTLDLNKALEIALSDNPTIKVAEEEIALKKVAYKEAYRSIYC